MTMTGYMGQRINSWFHWRGFLEAEIVTVLISLSLMACQMALKQTRSCWSCAFQSSLWSRLSLSTPVLSGTTFLLLFCHSSWLTESLVSPSQAGYFSARTLPIWDLRVVRRAPYLDIWLPSMKHMKVPLPYSLSILLCSWPVCSNQFNGVRKSLALPLPICTSTGKRSIAQTLSVCPYGRSRSSSV